MHIRTWSSSSTSCSLAFPCLGVLDLRFTPLQQEYRSAIMLNHMCDVVDSAIPKNIVCRSSTCQGRGRLKRDKRDAASGAQGSSRAVFIILEYGTLCELRSCSSRAEMLQSLRCSALPAAEPLVTCDVSRLNNERVYEGTNMDLDGNIDLGLFNLNLSYVMGRLLGGGEMCGKWRSWSKWRGFHEPINNFLSSNQHVGNDHFTEASPRIRLPTWRTLAPESHGDASARKWCRALRIYCSKTCLSVGVALVVSHCG